MSFLSQINTFIQNKELELRVRVNLSSIFVARGKVCDQEPQSQQYLTAGEVQETVTDLGFDLWSPPKARFCSAKQHLTFQCRVFWSEPCNHHLSAN